MDSLMGKRILTARDEYFTASAVKDGKKAWQHADTAGPGPLARPAEVDEWSMAETFGWVRRPMKPCSSDAVLDASNEIMRSEVDP